ncbi:MAG: threonine--tRNA ligase, partial [Gammaproteobacteria bacterium]|nr:threonine--tRNA ligase [Gammaproteobacteria bacterium]NIR26518.1 threonine--tRNA ligase [Gammaproteobacteria bacterium]NIX18315.1 threonine--tRNA ligase [Gammaproteobacteria bacterium]NIY19676.1 threonine--tRNA ligase [Gammaproteobacteria bacterium]
KQVCDDLRSQGIRVQADLRNEKLGFKIREAQMEKVPYMLVVGDQEVQTGTVTARHRSGENLDPMTTADFVRFIKEECKKHN